MIINFFKLLINEFYLMLKGSVLSLTLFSLLLIASTIFALALRHTSLGLEIPLAFLWIIIFFITIIKVEKVYQSDFSEAKLQQYILSPFALEIIIFLKNVMIYFNLMFFFIIFSPIILIILNIELSYLLQINGLRLIGGLLLLYIVYKLYVDVIKGSDHEDNIEIDNSNFFKAIWTILLADFTMSLDNVLGVAGAAGDHYALLVFGLILSIILMATAATLISDWIKRYKWIAWAGLLAILIVAIELIYTDIKILFL